MFRYDLGAQIQIKVADIMSSRMLTYINNQGLPLGGEGRSISSSDYLETNDTKGIHIALS